MLALLVLPFAMLYGVRGGRPGLVVLPLLAVPRGFQTTSVAHQLYESIFNTCFAAVYFVVFRIAHHMEGQDPPFLSSPNWDHEVLGLVFVEAGLVGCSLAAANVQTSIHIAFPVLYVAYTMISHAGGKKKSLATQLHRRH